MGIAEIINNVLQAIMFVLTINYCVSSQYKKNKFDVLILSFIIALCMQISVMVMGNSSLNLLVVHMIILLIILIGYKNDSFGIIISFSIIYFFIGINVLICSNVYGIYIKSIMPIKYLQLSFILFLYIPQYIMTYLILKEQDKIYKLYKAIRSKNLSAISLIVVTLILDFICSFNLISYDMDNPLFKNTIFILLGIFLSGITLYFANIEKKMKEIAMLNQALEEKIIELRKIKHDYGAQISYLYGLHLMEKHERLGELLKDIISGQQNVTNAVQIGTDEDSIISIVTKNIVDQDINVILDEQADIKDADIAEMELQRIISNILNNSITAMNGKGVITVRTSYNFNSIIIKIQNNGPQIDQKIIEKIFEVGFTTKVDEDKEHGLGLAIVKEIIENHNGSISVTSNAELTEFTIKLQLKSNRARALNCKIDKRIHSSQIS